MIEVRWRIVIIIDTFLTIILNFYNSNVLNRSDANNRSINMIGKLRPSICDANYLL